MPGSEPFALDITPDAEDGFSGVPVYECRGFAASELAEPEAATE